MEAVLILAHKDLEHVLRLSNCLSEKFEVFIHFDKKTTLSVEYKQLLNDLSIHYISEIDVKWGTWTVVEATKRLMELAMNNSEIDYIHLISGQDYPILSAEEIYNFYEGCTDINLKIFKAKDIVKSGEPILLWSKYYYDYSKINRKSFFGKTYHRLSIIWQTFLRVDKFKMIGFEDEILHGSNWAGLPRDAVEFLLESISTDSIYLRLFENSFCPDEFWMQTILGNSDTFKDRITHNNYRYINWERKYNSYPAILDVDDYKSVMDSGAHFARKLSSEHSAELMDKLDDKAV